MSKLSLFLGVLVTFGLQAFQTDSARMVAKSEHEHLARVVLSEHQQQLRKAALHTEASLVCGSPTIKNKLNKNKSVRGVQDIRWGDIILTAKGGLKVIEKDIETLTSEVEELAQKIKELEDAAKWTDLSDSAIDEMLNAACRVDGLKNDDGDCGRAAEFSCGWEDPADLDEIPFESAVDAFRASAENMFTDKKKRLSAEKFRKHCAQTLPNQDCEDLCFEFGIAVAELTTSEGSAVNMAETAILDEVINEHKAKTLQLQDAEAAKEDCIKAQVKLNEFAAELGTLSTTVKTSERSVGKYKRTLRSKQRRLDNQIKFLLEQKEKLAKAKIAFAAASAKVEATKEEVARMEAVLDGLAKELLAQKKLISELELKIADIEAATDASRLFKVQLSVTLENSVQATVEAIHQPLINVGVTPDRAISQDFDDAELAAAPAMKDTVRAVGEYCGTESVVNALTGMQLKGTSHQLNHICTGQDWDKMIEEAQGVVKSEAEEVVGILTGEQASVKADNKVSAHEAIKMKGSQGQPANLEQSVGMYGGENAKFVEDYLPGWKVEVTDDGKGEITFQAGKMLLLYQKLGEEGEKMLGLYQAAQVKAKQIQDQINLAVEQMKELVKKLEKEIKDKDVKEADRDRVQGIVNTAQETANEMERSVASTQAKKAAEEEAFDDASKALLTEHTQRTAALLQMVQELKG